MKIFKNKKTEQLYVISDKSYLEATSNLGNGTASFLNLSDMYKYTIPFEDMLFIVDDNTFNFYC